MAKQSFIKIKTICTHYQVETFFIDQLHEAGLIKIHIHEKSKCIHDKEVHQLDKIIRLHQDLSLTPEGIDVVLNLLDKINNQQQEIKQLKNELLLKGARF